MPLGVEKKESELVLAGDANIGFVAGSGVAEGGFVAEVEGVAVISGGLGIVEDGLVAEGHAEDSPEDLRGLAGGEGKGDVEGQHQAQHVGRTMQTGDVDGRPMGSGRGQLGGLEVVLAILVAQLELRAAELLQQLLVPVQGLLLLPVMRAVLARAFVDGAVGTLLPAEEGVAAVGAPVRSFRRAMTASDLRDAATDFAAQLAGFPAIVGVEEVAGCAAVGTTTRWQARGERRNAESETAVGGAGAGTEPTTAASARCGREAGAAGSRGPEDRRRNRGSADAAGENHRAVAARADGRRGSLAIAGRVPANPGG